MHVTSPPSFLPPIIFPSLFPFCRSRNPTARFATIFHWPTLLSLIHIPLPIIIHLASTCRMVAFFLMYLLLSMLGGVVDLPSMLRGRPASEPQSSGESSPVPRFIGKLTSTQGWRIPYSTTSFTRMYSYHRVEDHSDWSTFLIHYAAVVWLLW